MGLRIAQVATLGFAVPPSTYGAVERVVDSLTEGLIEDGHDVLLVAACGSSSSAELHQVPGTPWEFRRAGAGTHGLHDRMRVLRDIREALARRADALDVVHYHAGWMADALQPAVPIPSVTTLHVPLDTPEMRRFFGRWRAGPLVSVSDAQRRGVRDLDLPWVATVHNGLPLRERSRLGSGTGGYLAFLGRLSPDKDPASAMRAAIAAGVPIRVAGPAPWYDEDYLRDVLGPLLAHPLAEWVGEIRDEQKAAFLGDAVALVNTTVVPESCCLSIIEALGRGTPVIARLGGGSPELLQEGVHGFLAGTDGELESACRAAGTLDRRACREWALRRYSQQRMVRDYVRVYESVAGAAPAGEGP
jgi:glycosyltransferase involved in cell wall biosynthesis